MQVRGAWWWLNGDLGLENSSGGISPSSATQLCPIAIATAVLLGRLDLNTRVSKHVA